MNAKLAVAAIAALGIALEAAVLHAVVAMPLASAIRDSAEPQRPTFEEHILVQAVAEVPALVVPVRG
jgi:ABC-type tungstate transport system substrate-binding protein